MKNEHFSRILFLIIFLLVISGGYFVWQYLGTSEDVAQNEITNKEIYRNENYGFSFSLPKSWEKYSIVINSWQGHMLDSSDTEEGPQISIRHPKWTNENPRQDIPIMIFTINQWNAMQNDEFHIGAAPINPKELDRNNKYVFALPARYNFSFLEGYEEVEEILNNNSLQAF